MRVDGFSFSFRWRELLACKNGSVDNLGLEYLASLQKVAVPINSGYDNDEEGENQKTALRHAIQAHPNRPTLDTG